MVRIGPYPPEASFFPEHLIIALITLLVFLILLFVLASIRKAHPGQAFTIKGLEPSEVISLLSVVVAIVSAFVVPFTQLPIIDYSVTANPISIGEQGGGTQMIKLTLHVYGLIAAKNVIVSMSANNSQFGTLTSTPFLAKHLSYDVINATTDGGQTGKALLGIDALPARSHTIIEIPVVSQSPSTQSEPELITHLRSDAVVGYHQTTDLFAFYIILSAFYVSIAVALIKTKLDPLVKDPNCPSKGRDIVFIIGLGVVLIFAIGFVYAFLLS